MRLNEGTMTDDDHITMSLPRHEVAAVVLHHLKEADLFECELDSPGAVPLDLVRLRLPHVERVSELDAHMTDALREWVTTRRDEACRDLLVEGIKNYLNEASTEQLRLIYRYCRTLRDDQDYHEPGERTCGMEPRKVEAGHNMDNRTDDDSITVTLFRKEVAAILLHHLEVADFYEWLSHDPGDCDTHDYLIRRLPHISRVDELDPLLTPHLREWAKTRLRASWRKLQAKEVSELLEGYDDDAVAQAYCLKLRIERGGGLDHDPDALFEQWLQSLLARNEEGTASGAPVDLEGLDDFDPCSHEEDGLLTEDNFLQELREAAEEGGSGDG